MKDLKIRRRILEMVFERFKEHPYYRITPSEFKEALGITLKQLYYNVAYLAEKGYLDLQTPLEGSFFVGARITARGIDLVEDELQFDIIFPRPEQLTTPDNVMAGLALIQNSIAVDDNIQKEAKELLIEGISDIINELNQHEPSYSRIKTLLTRIRQRHEDVASKISTLLKTPALQKLLLASARKELEGTN
ncbi:hypothetical protein JXB22_07360 [candidate division WOR-3 bacterium]|nr:hypothetical protein [candidate division WOR-3 bacterium]